ncbi:MAG: SpoIID/LytB domain-containing protein [Thermodesulfobacteriota bacterium]
MGPVNALPQITVGIMDQQTQVTGRLNGSFWIDGFGLVSGDFSAKAKPGTIVLTDERRREICRPSSLRLNSQEGSFFSLFSVCVGNRFHWEKKEDQNFRGDLILKVRKNDTITVINEISLEDYLASVISSEVNPAAPVEFLKAHTILSRSWFLAGLTKEKRATEITASAEKAAKDEVVRWYDRQEHDLFDVCADDHCQRYHGITKVVAEHAQEAIRETHGRVITYKDKICDARYSKACGGLTEEFGTAWDDQKVSYLVSTSDASVSRHPITTEKEASSWILSNPEAYCNTRDERLLEKILLEVDRETKTFFRWRVEYSRTELEEILREKSDFDFGTLKDIVPLQRGPSGRISRLRIVGSKRSMIVGKELEIRRWLSPTHLYSSAFVVSFEGNRVILDGAGWGHGVGFCQIGAAVMATKGFSAEEILKHYFRGVEIKKIY